MDEGANTMDMTSAETLAMGHYTRVAQAVARMKLRPARKLRSLQRQVLKAEKQVL